MRKPPEMLVMLAPAVLVTAVVLAFGFVMGGDGDPADAGKAAGTVATLPSAASGDLADTEGRATQAKIPGPGVVITKKPRPKFRVYKPYSFTIASFNVLGHSHTVAGGDRSGFADGATRMGWTLSSLSTARVDLVGLQELESPQLRSLLGRAGDTWAVYPGNEAGPRGIANSIAWRKSTFEVVEANTVDIPYFSGRLRPMPYILLRHKETGHRLWIANFHNPANKYGTTAANTRYRRAATAREIALANSLAKTGWPVFFTGDFNERAEYFCPVTANTALKAANGGSTGGACSPPDRMPVDWIFGSDRIRFSDYVAIKGGLVARASDHPLVVADVRVPKDKVRIVYKKKKR